jgi:predicted secreted hydrolase
MGLLVRSFVLACLLAAMPLQAGWKEALPGWKYEFPRDHGSHPDFKTEWWYFTGNLRSADGREFGYQLTFFRQGVVSPGEASAQSRFVTKDIKLAHFTVSEIDGKKFHFFQKISRGAFGEAGFNEGSRLAWIDDWSCEITGENSFRLSARADELDIRLDLTSEKPTVIHGTNGVSQKAEGEGRASHYYSLTRLSTKGTLRLADREIPVSGLSWFDHEWATNQLTSDQVGWDWFSIQFDDGSELMLFQLRTKGGGRDPYSSGTYIAADGRTTTIANSDFTLKSSGSKWKSPHTKALYPIEWGIEIPKLDLKLDLRAAAENQELNAG